MKKRKEGSSLIIVLVISALVIILGSILVAAISFTTKANNNTKKHEDVLYAAESGIEKAYKVINNNGDSSAGKPVTVTEFPNMTVTVGINDETPSVTTNKTFKVTSTATDTNGRSRTVKAIYRKAIGNKDILNFNVCADDTEVNGTPGYYSVAKVNAQNSIISGGSIPPENVKGDAFNLPEFNFKPIKVGSAEVSEYKITEDPKTTLDALVAANNGVRKVASGQITAYLVNCPNLKLDLSRATNLQMTMIICSGNVNLTTTSTVDLSYGALIGEKVEIKPNIAGGGSVTISFPPVDRLNSTSAQALTDSIAAYTNNWGVGPGAGEKWKVTQYIY